jgi:hypothetical protein
MLCLHPPATKLQKKGIGNLAAVPSEVPDIVYGSQQDLQIGGRKMDGCAAPSSHVNFLDQFAAGNVCSGGKLRPPVSERRWRVDDENLSGCRPGLDLNEKASPTPRWCVASPTMRSTLPVRT